MRLIVLGSGTCVPSLTRNAPGYYLYAEGMHVLVDCGSGTLLQLERAGKSYRDIDAVFITHTHPDHISDIVPLIHALMATPGFGRTRKLSIIGPQGTRRYYDECVMVLLKRPKTFDVDVIEIEGKLDMGPFFVFAGRTVHSDNSIAYRFEDEGKSVVITGDCDYDGKLVDFARGADLLIADCSFPDKMKVSGHMIPKECGLLAKNAGVKKLVLSHIYSALSPDEERIAESRAVFDG
ncbi:MAG: MBL fold metallo-hydrolase, partial [Thermodesulfovibrionales bacterium]